MSDVGLLPPGQACGSELSVAGAESESETETETDRRGRRGVRGRCRCAHGGDVDGKRILVHASIPELEQPSGGLGKEVARARHSFETERFVR